MYMFIEAFELRLTRWIIAVMVCCLLYFISWIFYKVEFQVNKVCLMRKNGRFIRDLCKEKGLTQEQACGTVPNILESCIEMVQGQ